MRALAGATVLLDLAYPVARMLLRSILVGVIVLALRLLTFPRTPWDSEEMLFAQERLPAPVFLALGRIINILTGDRFSALVAVSIAASVATAVALAIAFRNITGDEDAGAIAALLFSLSAAALVHMAAARPEALALMFIALALVALTVRPQDGRPAFFGVYASLAIGSQPEMAAGVLAMVFAALILVWPDRPRRKVVAMSFAATTLLWLVPFVLALRPQDLAGYEETASAPPAFGAHTLIRFLLHPWGSKVVVIPLLGCVALGVRSVARRWSPTMEVLLWFAFVHLAAGIALVDPASGVRWALPSLMFTAIVAAAGLRTLPLPSAWIGAAVIAALSLWYVLPLVRERVARPSAIVAAARAMPRNVVVLHDCDTWPFAPRGGSMPLDAGLKRYLDEPAVPLVLLANGNTNAPNARVFSRSDDDAYGKLTRNQYRRVALIPMPAHERFVAVRGVHRVERNEAGESWRWLEPEAEIRLPKARAGSVRMELRLPPFAPFDANDVSIDGTSVTVRRGMTTVVDVPWNTHLMIRSSRSFVLADVVDGADTLRVGLQLIRIEQR
jgi:hypothetical protein